MNTWLRALAATGLVVAATAPIHALGQTERELTTFVYPKSANNTYRLPQYTLKNKSATGLSQCGKTKVDGLRFEPDGQTFHLDPLPPSVRTPFRRTVRVRRGTSSCFKAEVRVVVPILSDPEPSTWVIEWSPDRPKAIDIVVPSAQLAANADMRAAHRLEFPEASAPPQGDWTDCVGGCRWRIVADASVRRDFLTRAVIPVKVAALPITGLGARSGIVDPATGTLRPRPSAVPLRKWKISPNIFRSVTVRADQKEVTLDFPGAWALKPTPPDQEDPQLVHTESGPVLRFNDTGGRKAFVLTPGDGQLKAYLTLNVEGQSQQFLAYVARFGSTRARLPPDMKVCAPKPTTFVDVGAVGASMLPMPFVRNAARCRNPSGRVRLTLSAPVLREADISAMALDWRPQHPNRIDIYVRSKAIVQSQAIREDTELIVGDHPAGEWVGCFAKYCQYRIEGFSGASGLLTPTVGIRSKRLQAERSIPLDAVTGLPFQPQQIEVSTWRVPEPVITVGVPFLDGDNAAIGTINEPVARFFQSGPVACTAGGPCTIDPNEGAMAVRITGQQAIRVSTISVPNVATTSGISLAHIRGELWRSVKAQLRLKLSTCRYQVRQLSRAIAGLNEATVLYQARLLPGSSASCPGQDWSATLDTGERGHAQFSDGLLEVYLESIPRPGEGGSGVVNLNLSYPTGQAVRIKDGAKLAIEPAPNVGPPRVSVRLPGGDLRPLATTLAVNRPNILYFDMIDEPLDWGVELVRARSLYRPCRNDGGNTGNGTTDFSDDESYGSYCIIPNERTTDTLKLRFVRQGETKLLLRTGVDPAILPPEEQAKFRQIGWVEIETGRPAQPWSIAMNLVPVTQLHCGDRIVPPNAGPTPRAVNYDDFEECEVWVQLLAPARSGPEDATPQEDTLAFFGDQKIEVRGRLLDGQDNSGAKVLASEQLRAETEIKNEVIDGQVHSYLVIKVSLAEIGTNPPEDYDVVEIEVAHDADFYAPDSKWSSPQSVARLKVRRGPEYLAWWSDSGRGARLFGAFTAVPFSLFRYPHSGKGVTTSDALDGLEQANVALGIAGILEAWNFDYNESIIPVINPQLQIGALVSSNPTSGDLSLPGISLIAGIGLRTGVGTSPGKGVESSLKTVIWYEMLFQRDGRGNDPSHNLLFGFTVDLGSTPN